MSKVDFEKRAVELAQRIDQFVLELKSNVNTGELYIHPSNNGTASDRNAILAKYILNYELWREEYALRAVFHVMEPGTSALAQQQWDSFVAEADSIADGLIHDEVLENGGKPIVDFGFSESKHIPTGVPLSLVYANTLAGQADKFLQSESGYYKTDFTIKSIHKGEAHYYARRQDLGDGDGSLISHIKLANKGTLAYPSSGQTGDIEAAQQIIDYYVPFLSAHLELEKIETAASIFISKYEGTNVNHVVLSEFRPIYDYHVACMAQLPAMRTQLNAGVPIEEIPALPKRPDLGFGNFYAAKKDVDKLSNRIIQAHIDFSVPDR